MFSFGKPVFLSVSTVKEKVSDLGAGCDFSDWMTGVGPAGQHGCGLCHSLILRLPFAPQANEWNKNDDRLLQAVENGDAEKVASLLGKKGATATKQDSEGKTA